MGQGEDRTLTARERVGEEIAAPQLREMLDHLPAFAALIGRDHRLLWINRTQPGVTADEILGRTLSELSHPETVEAVRTTIESAFVTGELSLFESRGALGDPDIWYRTSVVPLPAPTTADAARALILTTEITGERAAMEAVRQSERRFRTLTEASPDIIVILDGEQRITYANRAPNANPCPNMPPVQGLRFADLVRREDAPVASKHAAHCFESGRPTEFVAIGAADGRCYSVRINRLGAAGPAGCEALVTLTDVTEQRHAERERRLLEGQLQHAQKLDTVGRLAGGIAHDFNNLLMVIQAHLDFATQAITDGDDIVDELLAISDATRRAVEMTRQLLTIGRKETPQRRDVDLGEVVRHALTLLKRAVPSRIELEVTQRGHALPIHADPHQLEQVVMNLCLNARDAIAAQGHIRFHMEPKNGRASLTVSDTGSGMSEATAARVFEPFFTTKGPGRGTGLGLSVAHSLVVQNDGSISLHSEQGRGTTVRLEFPLHAQPQAENDDATAATVPLLGRLGGATILFAEDDPAIRRIVERVLHKAGYRVLTACDGERAVALFREHANEVDLLLLDAVMPTLGGRDAFEQIRQMHPNVKALFSSGYAAEALPRSFLEQHHLEVLPKPYRPAQLLEAIHGLLSTR